MINTKIILASLAVMALSFNATAQEKAKPADTEIWTPVPVKVEVGIATPMAAPPSDAVVLFNGKGLDEWVSNADRSKPATWKIDGDALVVNKSAGNIETKRMFGSYQLHLEWKIPANIAGEGQARGNSGVFLASLGKGDPGYELQILDSYQNNTYVNGMAGSIYKQFAPLANAARKPGEWQTYDVLWNAPVFDDNGTVKQPATVTVIWNGIVVQNSTTLLGPTQYIGKASYSVKHGKAPIKLQAHGDKSEPISFRNIWVREL